MSGWWLLVSAGILSFAWGFMQLLAGAMSDAQSSADAAQKKGCSFMVAGLVAAIVSVVGLVL